MLIILFHGSLSVSQELQVRIYLLSGFSSSLELCRICVHVASERIFLSSVPSDSLSYGYLNGLAQIPEETQISSTGAL